MVVPINKAVIDTFKSAPRIQYAKHDDGSLYISNGQYLLKTNQAGIDRLTGQVNKHRKASGNIAVTENPRMLSYVDIKCGVVGNAVIKPSSPYFETKSITAALTLSAPARFIWSIPTLSASSTIASASLSGS